jgi:hypothetical protein
VKLLQKKLSLFFPNFLGISGHVRGWRASVMAHRWSTSDLKVDATSLTSEDQQILVLYNINVPIDLVNRETLLRVRTFLEDEFRTHQVFFQLTATYLIKNNVTGEEKIWKGSFLARNNVLAQLSDFVNLRTVNFVPYVLNIWRTAEDKLNWQGADTSWSFQHLVSLVINAQTKVNEDDRLLQRRRLFSRGTKKPHVTFELP